MDIKKIKERLEKYYPEDETTKVKKKLNEIEETKRNNSLLNFFKEASIDIFLKISNLLKDGLKINNFPEIQKIEDIEKEKRVAVINFDELTELEINRLKEILPIETIIKNVISANINNFPKSIKISNFPISNEIVGNVKISNFPSKQEVHGEVKVQFPEIQKISGEVNANVNFPKLQDVIIKNWPVTQEITGQVEVNFPEIQKVEVINSIDTKRPEIQKIEGTVKTDIKIPEIQKVEVVNVEKQNDEIKISNFPEIQKVETGIVLPEIQKVEVINQQKNKNEVKILNFPTSQKVEIDKPILIKAEKQAPENYVPVRLTDGKEWLEKISEVLTTSTLMFKNTSNQIRRAVVDSDDHIQVDVLSSELPTDAATETTLSKIPGLSVPIHDYISLGYSGSDLTTVVYKTGGASGTTVATVTLSYSGSNLVSVTKT